ncbi:MAG: hypothetical protein KatS3mg060_1326 [Dehalococcoidia bacterium]|nr:MAG: hypothetical protein KatS3mg060_1326 [Dehalococcoidia bacterium]
MDHRSGGRGTGDKGGYRCVRIREHGILRRAEPRPLLRKTIADGVELRERRISRFTPRSLKAEQVGRQLLVGKSSGKPLGEGGNLAHDSSTSRMVRAAGPWTPIVKTRSISPVRLGPLTNVR